MEKIPRKKRLLFSMDMRDHHYISRYKKKEERERERERGSVAILTQDPGVHLDAWVLGWRDESSLERQSPDFGLTRSPPPAFSAFPVLMSNKGVVQTSTKQSGSKGHEPPLCAVAKKAAKRNPEEITPDDSEGPEQHSQDAARCSE